MIGFSKSLAQEIASRNVTVNCVAPGFIESAMTDKLNDKQKEAIMSAIPMRRMGTGAEVAFVGCLSCQQRSRLRHRPDNSRQWRHGNDLTTAWAPDCSRWYRWYRSQSHL